MPTKRVKGKKKLKSIKAKLADNVGSKRRLSRFGKEQKKGMRGASANYLSRSQALKKLQITLKDFRRLCILKGIYPREPTKKKSSDMTYYHLKDISYLSHEPLLVHFRKLKMFMKKISSSIGKKHFEEAQRRHENRPTHTLDHLVKERYPRFTDALSDLDDALCLLHLFAVMPRERGIPIEMTEQCLRLVQEWQNYIVQSQSLAKVFVSIKGIYYQANVRGETITWLVPHTFVPITDKRVDLRVMATFVEFYQALIKFVNFQLYSDLGLCYPPKIDIKLDQAGMRLKALRLEKAQEKSIVEHGSTDAEDLADEEQPVDDAPADQLLKSEERLKTLAETLGKVDESDEVSKQFEDDNEVSEGTYGAMAEPLDAAFASNELAVQLHENEQKEKSQKNLFKNFVFFLSREVPLSILEFVLCSHGATIGWEGPGSLFSESSEYITHHIVDRPHQKRRYFNREYIQPQWVFDCVNNGFLLPIALYAPGAELPPHLSPFVNDEAEGYVPEYRKQLKSAAEMLRGKVLQKDATHELVKQSVDDNDEDEEEAYTTGLQAELKDAESCADDSDDADLKKGESNSADSQAESDSDGSNEAQQPKLSANPEKKRSRNQKAQDEEKELHEMAKNMMSKKAKRLYDRMQHGLGKKSDKIQRLESKRAELDRQKKKSSKSASPRNQ